MDAGIYHDTFIDVEYTKYETTYDFMPALTSALASLGIVAPITREEATKAIIRKHLSDIAEHRTAPFEGLGCIIGSERLDLGPVKKCVGDYYNIEHFIGAYWEYDDFLGRGERFTPEELAAEEGHIVSMAIDWLKNN